MKNFKYLFLVILFVISGVAQAKDKPDINELPQTLEEAVDDIVSGLSEEDKNTVKETPFDDLIMYHFGWGMGIRNSLGLWGGNTELLKSACGGTEYCHPDDASMEIIYGVWNVLNGNPYRFKPASEEP